MSPSTLESGQRVEGADVLIVARALAVLSAMTLVAIDIIGLQYLPIGFGSHGEK